MNTDPNERRFTVMTHLMLALLMGCVLALTACSAGHPDAFPEATAPTPLAPAKRPVDVHFYLDTSGSMRGFLAESPRTPQLLKASVHANANPLTHFSEVLETAVPVLGGDWPDSNGPATVHLWKFGSGTPTSIPSLRAYLDNPRLFADNATHIQNAISHKLPETQSRQVRIIVTDLYQDDNDVGLLASQLDRYLKDEDSAVGVIGIRNRFFGNVSDLPGKGLIKAGGVDTMPFYILITGSAADVRHAMSLVQTRMCTDLSPDSTLRLFFSRRLMSNLSQPVEVTYVAKTAKDPVASGISPDRDMVSGPKEKYAQQVDVQKHKASCPAAFYLAGEEAENVGSPVLGLKSTLKLSLYKWSPQGQKWVEPPDSAMLAFHDNFRSLLAPDATGKKLQIAEGTISVDANALPSETFYLARYQLSAQEYRVTGLEDWNLSTNESKRMVQNGQFDKAADGTHPGKTPNLALFLQTIADHAFREPVLLARYYIYMKIM